jgi:hypothetical protein
MDKEEREKYHCVKDDENLAKVKSGTKSFYISQRDLKATYGFIAGISVYLLVLSIGAAWAGWAVADSTEKTNSMLINQLNTSIKKDFKNMSCPQKAVFINNYEADPNTYESQGLKTYLHNSFTDNCPIGSPGN